MGITACYAACLYVCAQAVGTPLSVLHVFLVLTLGVAASSVTPTPGGIGGAEAAMIAGLASLGVPVSQGIPIALVYRLVTYWLPLVPGFIAFHIALRRSYI
jgi:uncharacterized protein (TIRG00374 family)